MTGSREAQLLEAANLFLDARRTVTPMDALPPALTPENLEEAYFVQDTLAASYGPIGGYKIGAPSPEATPIFCPMPAAWIAPAGATLSAATHRFRGLEAEIAFLLAQDLPARSTPYTHQEVYAAVASCHPAIEVLESGLTDPTLPELRFSQFADLQMHGGFVFGPSIPQWQTLDFAQEHVTLNVDGAIRVERTGSNTSGDLRRLLPFLANQCAARTGGLRAGQWITTGSWTGVTLAHAGSTAEAHFSNAGKAALRFE